MELVCFEMTSNGLLFICISELEEQRTVYFGKRKDRIFYVSIIVFTIALVTSIGENLPGS